jgi:4-hydroxybenzoate polyprenyltransferase
MSFSGQPPGRGARPGPIGRGKPAAPAGSMGSPASAGSTGPAERRGRVRAFLRLVMIQHSVFALPFAYVSALTAMLLVGEDGRRPGSVGWATLALVTVAMVAGRTFAMAANRLIDRHVDARNPRTARRELVTGVVSTRTAVVGAVAALGAFLAAAAALNPLCLALAPLAVAPLIGYPYAKRVTDLPHAVLGLAQAVAPVGAWIAVTGAWDWRPVVLGLAVGTWIGGFDLIYACQDAEVDRVIGVRSAPARWGVAAALRASTVTHVVTFALLVWWGLLVGYGPLWYAGLVLTALAFGYEHRIVRPDDLSRVNRAFFTANGVVGLGLLAFAAADLFTAGLRL